MTSTEKEYIVTPQPYCESYGWHRGINGGKGALQFPPPPPTEVISIKVQCIVKVWGRFDAPSGDQRAVAISMCTPAGGQSLE